MVPEPSSSKWRKMARAYSLSAPCSVNTATKASWLTSFLSFPFCFLKAVKDSCNISSVKFHFFFHSDAWDLLKLTDLFPIFLYLCRAEALFYIYFWIWLAVWICRYDFLFAVWKKGERGKDKGTRSEMAFHFAEGLCPVLFLYPSSQIITNPFLLLPY